MSWIYNHIMLLENICLQIKKSMLTKGNFRYVILVTTQYIVICIWYKKKDQNMYKKRKIVFKYTFLYIVIANEQRKKKSNKRKIMDLVVYHLKHVCVGGWSFLDHSQWRRRRRRTLHRVNQRWLLLLLLLLMQLKRSNRTSNGGRNYIRLLRWLLMVKLKMMMKMRHWSSWRSSSGSSSGSRQHTPASIDSICRWCGRRRRLILCWFIFFKQFSVESLLFNHRSGYNRVCICMCVLEEAVASKAMNRVCFFVFVGRDLRVEVVCFFFAWIF